MNSVGIYVGLFDPVHAGHVAFALQVLQEADLEAVYFLPERMPTHTRPIEHYGHRVAMLDRALAPHNQLEIIELADKRFRAMQTIPRLRQALGVETFTFLCSAPNFVRMLQESPSHMQAHRFIVSIENKDQLQVVTNMMELYAVPLNNVTIVDALRPDIATEYVRLALSRNKSAPGLLPSVARYAKAEWLYAQLPRQPRELDKHKRI